MRLIAPGRRALLAALAALPLLAGAAGAAELKVMSSGGFTAALRLLIPEFEKATGHSIRLALGASMGNAPDAIPNRLARGEAADVVIIAGEAIDRLIAEGRLLPGSRTDLVLSRIGVAVPAGAPKPDISTPEAVRRMLLEARSIAYSASASGVYFATEMVQRLGIADEVLPKSRRILSERVAAVVARGEAEIGFQQVSEILGIPGADYVGPLPEALQRVTAFSAGYTVRPEQPEAARELVAFLRSPAAHDAIRSTGLDPAP
ncbi:substrate-binding domain-containing protein [Roseicella aerolata]|uniref:Substrate-binding domain-containing protein n=1 Tax=Roseicella aerolata TaxID=2883479 RepID=A0A9X1L9T9_9PROT|nr:substrate-binding domain-containing protein [Roseicella aerolata]MCB4821468.1 substrate-binding domain-containing protein [Roseicella aerolata]